MFYMTKSAETIFTDHDELSDYLGFLGLGVAKIRVRVNSGSDKSDIQTKISYPKPVRIINRTFKPDPDSDPDVRCPDPIVRMS